jgi:hypothetical protein
MKLSKEMVLQYLTNPSFIYGIHQFSYVKFNHTSQILDLGELGILTTICEYVITQPYDKVKYEYNEKNIYPEVRKYLASAKRKNKK